MITDYAALIISLPVLFMAVVKHFYSSLKHRFDFKTKSNLLSAGSALKIAREANEQKMLSSQNSLLNQHILENILFSIEKRAGEGKTDFTFYFEEFENFEDAEKMFNSNYRKVSTESYSHYNYLAVSKMLSNLGYHVNLYQDMMYISWGRK
jgi:hypothetical protein